MQPIRSIGKRKLCHRLAALIEFIKIEMGLKENKHFYVQCLLYKQAVWVPLQPQFFVCVEIATKNRIESLITQRLWPKAKVTPAILWLTESAPHGQDG